jgi:ABC-type nickel/cobalt efflux system permease component RcnA
VGSPPAIASAAQPAAAQVPDSFANLIATKELTPQVILLALLLALILGAGHALTPGHGTTIVAAYLVGNRGNARHALFLGIVTTITHTVGVFVLGFVTLLVSNYVLPERLYPWLEFLSGVLVAGIGLVLFRHRLADLLGYRRSHHEHHEHGHDHHHGHEHTDHSHLPPGADDRPVTWRSLLALGVSGGLLPCPSALVVLLGAIALHRVAFGMLLIVVFSFGLAGILTGIGLLLVYARRLFERFPSDGRLLRTISVASAVVVTLAGLVIAAGALAQVGWLPI